MPVRNLFTPSGRQHSPQTGITRGSGGSVSAGTGGGGTHVDPMSLLNTFFGLKDRYDASKAEDVVVKRLMEDLGWTEEQSITAYNSIGPEKAWNLLTDRSEAEGIGHAIAAQTMQGYRKEQPGPGIPNILQSLVKQPKPTAPAPTGTLNLSVGAAPEIQPKNALLGSAGSPPEQPPDLLKEPLVEPLEPSSEEQELDEEARLQALEDAKFQESLKPLQSKVYEQLAEQSLKSIDKTREASPSDFIEYEGKSLAIQEIPEFRNPISGDIATSAEEIEANKLLWEDPSSMRIARNETSIREDILLRRNARITMGRIGGNIPTTDLLGNRLAGDAGFNPPKFSADIVEYLASQGLNANLFDTTNPIHVALLAQGGGNNAIYSPFFVDITKVLSGLNADQKEYYLSRSSTQVAQWKKMGQAGADLMHADYAKWLGEKNKVEEKLASASNSLARTRLIMDEKNRIQGAFVASKQVMFYNMLVPLVLAARESTKGRKGREADKGVQDISLVKALNRFLEPNSAVLGAEFQTIFQALAVKDQTKAWWEAVMSGGLKITDEQRQGIIDFGMNLEAASKVQQVFPEIDRAKAQLDYLNSHLELGDSMVDVTDPITGEKTKEVVDMRARLSLIIDPKLLQDWTIYKAGRLPQAKKQNRLKNKND